jgi:hypothetical protein
MTDRPATPERDVSLTRLAWLVSIATPVALIGLLCLLKAAHAAAPVAGPPSASAEELEEECFEFEEGVLECEQLEPDTSEAGPFPPEECLLRTARARVLTYATRNRLRAVVRYSSLAPTRAYIDFRMRSGSASLSLGLVRRHLSRRGVIRLSASLDGPRMELARDAREFVLTMDLPSTPDHCRRHFTRRLTVKRTVEGQSVWFQSDPVFGTAG